MPRSHCSCHEPRHLRLHRLACVSFIEVFNEHLESLVDVNHLVLHGYKLFADCPHPNCAVTRNSLLRDHFAKDAVDFHHATETFVFDQQILELVVFVRTDQR